MKDSLVESRVKSLPVELVVKRLKRELLSLAEEVGLEGACLPTGDIWNIPREELQEYFLEELTNSIAGVGQRMVLKLRIRPLRLHPEFINRVKELITRTAKNYGWVVLTDELGEWDLVMNLVSDVGIRVTDVPFTLYHISEFDNVKNILKKGIVPRTARKVHGFQKRNYGPRVYLTTTYEMAMRLAGAFDSEAIFDAIQYGGEAARSYVVLDVDTTKLAKGTKFYYDPEFSGDRPESIYTFSNIPKEAITINKHDVETWQGYAKFQEELEKEHDEYSAARRALST